MNEKDHKPDDRLDRMLRKWGVDEASRKVNIPPMPEMSPQRRWQTILLRWGPPVAAAAMLLVAVGLFVAERSGGVAAPSAQEDVQGLKTQLAQAQADLKKARTALAQADSRHAGEVEQLNTEIAAMKKDFQKEKANFLAGAEQQIADLNRIVKTQNKKLETLNEKLTRTGRELADAKKRYSELVGSKDATRTKLAAAVSELDRVSKRYRQVLTDSQKTQSELVTLKTRHKSVLGDFQRAYLAAASEQAALYREASSRRVSLPLRQSAARGARLLERCAEIRPSVQATSAGMLMDRLEVVLTRLNLLDPADPAEAEAFAALVRRGGLVKKIDETLAGGRQRADIRIWLLETRLILEGAENVG